jgi:hypothetical protein
MEQLHASEEALAEKLNEIQRGERRLNRLSNNEISVGKYTLKVHIFSILYDCFIKENSKCDEC